LYPVVLATPSAPVILLGPSIVISVGKFFLLQLVMAQQIDGIATPAIAIVDNILII
jgi:hypothetical protein